MTEDSDTGQPWASTAPLAVPTHTEPVVPPAGVLQPQPNPAYLSEDDDGMDYAGASDAPQASTGPSAGLGGADRAAAPLAVAAAAAAPGERRTGELGAAAPAADGNEVQEPVSAVDATVGFLKRTLFFLFLLGVSQMAINVAYTYLTGEDATQTLLSVLSPILVTIGYVGVRSRSQITIMVWLCIQSCTLCCSIMALVALLAAIVSYASPVDSGSNSQDLTPTHDKSPDERTDAALGVAEIFIAIASFLLQSMACMMGLRLNGLLSAPATGTLTQATLTINWPAFAGGMAAASGGRHLSRYMTALGDQIPFAAPYQANADNDADDAAGVTPECAPLLALPPPAPITVYGPGSQLLGLADATWQQAADPLLIPDSRMGEYFAAKSASHAPATPDVAAASNDTGLVPALESEPFGDDDDDGVSPYCSFAVAAS
mgnify:CR=1 FL=1